jgi:D-beta-D-heptose 7-phosphate kinase/D-beta-D-heptose 1-phosphate adenosyltransferase
MKIVLVTGGFDPIHSGHIAYFKSAKLLGDMLIVGLNSDEWLERKKGRAFMPWSERLCIINNLTMVDEVYTFDDEDGSAKHFIQQVRAHYPDSQLIFANGGDRTATNIPEMDVNDNNIEFVFGIGGEDKKNSSSWILEDWRTNRTERAWGCWKVISDVDTTVKVKELIVTPGKKLSMQRHQHRNEFWYVVKGEGRVNWRVGATDIQKHSTIRIDTMEWHQLENTGTTNLHVIEIQHGSECVEDDIERLRD